MTTVSPAPMPEPARVAVLTASITMLLLVGAGCSPTPTADESSLKDMVARVAREFPRVHISTRTTGPARHGHRIVVHLESASANEDEATQSVLAAQRRL